MKISYSKDYRHNYLVISDDRVIDNSYQFKMLERNEVEGLLRIQKRMINGEGLLCYDITSKQSVRNYFETQRIGFDDVKQLIMNLNRTLEHLRSYLLRGGNLMLNEELVFVDLDTGEYSFLFNPFSEDNKEEGMNSLLSYLMEHLDNDDLKAVEAVYQMADIMGRQMYSLEETVEWFINEYEEETDIEKVLGNSEPIEADYSDLVSADSEAAVDYKMDSNMKSKDMKQKKQNLFRRILAWLREEDQEDVFETAEPEYPEYQGADTQQTMYVPWVENTQQKLYGVGKNKYHIDLSKVPITVGSLESAATMVIKDASISRMHARFTRDQSKFYITDLNSTNGCYRNGIRLDPNETATIEPGDEIGLGKLKFVYR